MKNKKLQLHKIISFILLVLIVFVSTPIIAQDIVGDPTNDPALKAKNNPFKIGPKLKKPENKNYNNMVMSLSAFDQLSKKEIISKLHEGLKDKEIYPYIKDRPVFFTAFAQAIEEKTPLLNLMLILDDEPKMVKFSAVMMLTIILGFILKRFFLKKTDGSLYHFFHFMVRLIILFVIRVNVVIYFYGNELRPIYKIIKNSI